MLENITLSETKEGNYTIQRITRNDYYHQNTYIIADIFSKKQIIINPGDNEFFLESVILKNNYPLFAILFTHGHFDHVGGAKYLSEKFDVQCYVHESDMKLVRQAPNYALLFEKKKISSPLKLISLSYFSESFFANNPYPRVNIAGSCCFLLDNIIFTGDTLLFNETGRTDLPGGPEEKLKESLSLIYSICNESTIFYPGHGGIFKFTDIKEI